MVRDDSELPVEIADVVRKDTYLSVEKPRCQQAYLKLQRCSQSTCRYAEHVLQKHNGWSSHARLCTAVSRIAIVLQPDQNVPKAV